MTDLPNVPNVGSDASFVRWVQGLQATSSTLKAFADEYEWISKLSVDGHPINAALRERLMANVRRLRAAYDASLELPKQAEYGDNAADLGAYFQPRDGSLTKEQRADVRHAQVDTEPTRYVSRHAAPDPEPEPAPPTAPPKPKAKKRRPLRDALRLAKKIRLDGRQKLVGSDKIDGESGNARIAVVEEDGQRKVRVGVGGHLFGTKEGGGWNGSVNDDTEAINRERRGYRDEYDKIEDRFGEIGDAEKHAKISGDGPLRPLDDLWQQYQRVWDRKDLMDRHDQKCAMARRDANWDGDPDTDPAAAFRDQAPYSTGEYEELSNECHRLSQLHELHKYNDLPDPRPAEPGEEERLRQRAEELEDKDWEEVYSGGYTAELDPDAARKLRDDIGTALDVGHAEFERQMGPWREYGVLDDERSALRYKQRRERLDDQEQQRLAELEVLAEAEAARAKAITDQFEPSGYEVESGEYQVFTESSVPGQGADVHYRVELDDYSQGLSIVVGAVPHGSGKTLSDLSGDEDAMLMGEDEARKFVAKLDQAVEAPAPETEE